MHSDSALVHRGCVRIWTSREVTPREVRWHRGMYADTRTAMVELGTGERLSLLHCTKTGQHECTRTEAVSEYGRQERAREVRLAPRQQTPPSKFHHLLQLLTQLLIQTPPDKFQLLIRACPSPPGELLQLLYYSRPRDE